MKLVYSDFDNEQASNQRQCGDCTSCCSTMGVSVLNKPAGQRCDHQNSQGCTAHADRPQACAEWNCMWLADTNHIFNDEHRPDKIGLLFTTSDKDPITGAQVIYAHENSPNASQTEEAEELVRFLRQFNPVKVLPAHQHGDTAACLSIDGTPVS